MKPSLAPILLAIELTLFFMVAWRSRRLGPLRSQGVAIWLYLSWLTAYGAATSVLGARGVYVADDLLRWLPGLWLQLVTVAACVLPVVLSRKVRNGLRKIVDDVPWHWFAYFHALRVAALGTAYKTIVGEFPLYFELLIGVPDLAFGVSALWIARKARRAEISARAFRSWNLTGALVIVPAAPILLQMGLPGPIQVFPDLPDARALFTFPMSIAAIVGVPFFVLSNLLVAWRLSERGASATPPPTYRGQQQLGRSNSHITAARHAKWAEAEHRPPIRLWLEALIRGCRNSRRLTGRDHLEERKLIATGKRPSRSVRTGRAPTRDLRYYVLCQTRPSVRLLSTDGQCGALSRCQCAKPLSNRSRSACGVTAVGAGRSPAAAGYGGDDSRTDPATLAMAAMVLLIAGVLGDIDLAIGGQRRLSSARRAIHARPIESRARLAGVSAGS